MHNPVRPTFVVEFKLDGAVCTATVSPDAIRPLRQR